MPPVSNFHEINVRTYVSAGGKPGVYFLSIEAGKALSAYLSRKLSGMPYEPARIKRQQTASNHSCAANNPRKAFNLQTRFQTGPALSGKSPLDLWLTERYCAYVLIGTQVYRYNIHHRPWPLQEVQVNQLHTGYRFGKISLDRSPDRIHYSPGVKVIAWKRERVIG